MALEKVSAKQLHEQLCRVSLGALDARPGEEAALLGRVAPVAQLRVLRSQVQVLPGPTSAGGLLTSSASPAPLLRSSPWPGSRNAAGPAAARRGRRLRERAARAPAL